MQGQLGRYGFPKVSSVLRIIIRHFRIGSEILRIDGRDFPVGDIAEASIELCWIGSSQWIEGDLFLGLLLRVESLAHRLLADGDDGGRESGAVWTWEDVGAAEEGRGPSRGGRQHCRDEHNAGRRGEGDWQWPPAGDGDDGETQGREDGIAGRTRSRSVCAVEGGRSLELIRWAESAVFVAWNLRISGFWGGKISKCIDRNHDVLSQPPSPHTQPGISRPNQSLRPRRPQQRVARAVSFPMTLRTAVDA
jgi:hypothetical protein